MVLPADPAKVPTLVTWPGPDTNAGVVTVNIHLVDIFAPLIAGNITGHCKQTGTTSQHLFVVQQAFFDGGFQLQGLGAKAGFRAVFDQPDGNLPEQYGDGNGNCKNQPGNPGIAKFQ